MKRTALLLIITLLVISFVSCGGNDRSENNGDIVTGAPDNGGNNARTSEVLDDIYKNSSLPVKLYTYYDELPDADDMTPGGEYSSVFTLVDEYSGCEYKLTGADNIEDCYIVSIRWSSPRYAFFGHTVGDPADDIGIMLTPLGFEEHVKDDAAEYTQGGLSVIIGINDMKISSFTICAEKIG